jgi:intracellular sulfur oxidation DsrE/DsrF family protein
MKSSALSVLVSIGALVCTPIAHAEDTPYGSSKFAPYKDIDGIKQLKAVWDFNFIDPNTIGSVFNNINALLKATADFGPHEIDPVDVVVITHGPELVVFAKQNYAKYKEIVDRAAALTSRGVRFEACRNAATAQGFAPEDLHGFVTVVPAGPYALAYYQAKGYSLNAVGATMPTPPISSANKDDLKKK